MMESFESVGFEEDDERRKIFVHLNVNDPRIVDLSFWRRRYATYAITIQTNHWAFTLTKSSTRRRYAEFLWLRRQLLRHHPNMRLPNLPAKKHFCLNKLRPEFLQARCKGLCSFLTKLTKSPVCLAEKIFHLFLQTDLTIAEIHANIKGERDDVIGLTTSLFSTTTSTSTEMDSLSIGASSDSVIIEVPPSMITPSIKVSRDKPLPKAHSLEQLSNDSDEALSNPIVAHSVDSGRSSRFGDEFSTLRSESHFSLSSNDDMSSCEVCADNCFATERLSYTCTSEKPQPSAFVPVPVVCI